MKKALFLLIALAAFVSIQAVNYDPIDNSPKDEPETIGNTALANPFAIWKTYMVTVNNEMLVFNDRMTGLPAPFFRTAANDINVLFYPTTDAVPYVDIYFVVNGRTYSFPLLIHVGEPSSGMALPQPVGGMNCFFTRIKMSEYFSVGTQGTCHIEFRLSNGDMLLDASFPFEVLNF